MKNQKILTGIVLLVIVGLMGAVVLSGNSFSQKNGEQEQGEPPSAETDFVIFSSDNCPFCREVEQWIEQNNVHQSLDITVKSVSADSKYARELEQVAISCRINPTQVGVPLMYAEDQCYSGSVEIIEFLSAQMDGSQPGAESSPEIEINQEQLETQPTNDIEDFDPAEEDILIDVAEELPNEISQ